MKVAIIGAGIAGLSCAHELEKFGIMPVIYERNSYIGEQFSHVAAVLNISHRPIKDMIKYVEKNYGINITPLNVCDELVHYGPSSTSVIKGKFGYLLERGRGPGDLKMQLYSQLNRSTVLFNTPGDYNKLSKDYDYVVIATGNHHFTQELGCWKYMFKAFAKGGTILANYKPTSVHMYLNRDYCKNGYGYIVPYDNQRAFAVLVIPNVNEKEVDYYWQTFLNMENINSPITEEFKLEHSSGLVYPGKLGNILFAGNAVGSVDPFLGFGQFYSIATGVWAARAIAKEKDYEKSLKTLHRRNAQMNELRLGFDKLGNTGFDLIVKSIALPGVNRMVYGTNINFIKYSAKALKMIRKIK